MPAPIRDLHAAVACVAWIDHALTPTVCIVQAVSRMTLRRPRIPVFCNASGQPVTSADEAGGLVAQAACAPVRLPPAVYTDEGSYCHRDIIALTAQHETLSR